jgi:alanine racemase
MAVIKANAYGHGAVAAARALTDADAFAVASVEEAVQLREAGVSASIVLLEGIFEPEELATVSAHRLQMVVHTEEQVRWLEEARSGPALCLWLKINTGMNRLGFAPEDAPGVWQRLQRLPCIDRGCMRWMSHLSCADECDNPVTSQQLHRFTGAVQNEVGERSLANSAALLTRPDTHLDWVRPGIMLYGASPVEPECKLSAALRPAMTFESRLIAVHRHGKGDPIGYGQSWTCPEDMTVGVVAAGYADGYPRHAPNGTPVLVNGRHAALVGRVSMDMLCVDLRGQRRARAGDPVVLWGEGLPVETVAAHAGTISYELLCGVGVRVPRVYQYDLRRPAKP